MKKILLLILRILSYLTLTLWTVYATQICIYSILSFCYKPKNKRVKAKNVEFVVVTIASKKVKGALYQVLENIKTFERTVNVVTDEGAELLNELKNSFPDYSFTVVPKSFRCKAIAKGRAIEYFIRNKVKPTQWYVYLDDDSYPLDDKFLYEISSREKHDYVAANGLLYPRQGKNVYTYIIDWFRYLDDLTVFRACQGFLKSPVCGFHGELLIVKGSTLIGVTFNRKSITEDFSFGIQIVRKGYKTWSSRTKVSIQSPNSFKDFMTQRARWFKGILLDLKHAPFRVQVVMGILLVRAILGFSTSFIFLMLWVGLSLMGFNFIPFNPVFIVGTLYWVVGMFLLPKAPLKYKLLAIPLAVVEVMAPVYALKSKEFDVIDKN